MPNFLTSLIPWRKPKQDNTAVIEAEANKRVRALNRAIRENIDPTFMTGADVMGFLDRFYANGQLFLPITTAVPAIGGTQNKQFGWEAYTFRTEFDLRLQRDYARLLYAREPVAKAIVLHLSSFILGNGFTYRVEPKKNASVPEAEVANAQRYLDEWCEDNSWSLRERELVECKVVDGEFFLRFFNNKGDLQMRLLQPEHITTEPGKSWLDGWFLGVKVVYEDVETVLGYGYKSLPDRDWKFIDVLDIIHHKANVGRATARGVSDFFPMLDDLDSISKLSDNIRSGAAARAEVAYMRSHKTATASTVNAFADSVADMTGNNAITGKTERRAINRTGKVVDHGENMEYTTMPQGDVIGNVEALQMALRLIGNRWGMPEYMISADASNANYASTLQAGGPFVRAVESEQNQLKFTFKKVMREVLKHGASQGDIPISLLKSLEVNVEAPSPVIQDKIGMAQTMEIEVRNGARSRQMWSQQLGLDPEKVQQDNDAWADRNLATPAASGVMDLFSTGVANSNKNSNMNADNNTTRGSESDGGNSGGNEGGN